MGRERGQGDPARKLVVPRLEEIFGDWRAYNIKRNDIEDYLANFRTKIPSRSGKPRADATVKREHALLAAIFNRAVWRGRLTESPVWRIKPRKENNRRMRWITEPEELALIAALPKRLCALTKIAVHTGIRLGNLLDLLWTDISTELITIRKSKSGYSYQVPMNPVVLHELATLRDTGSEYVFAEARGSARTNLIRYWPEACRRAGISDFHFHDLRHTFASRLVMKGVSLYTVSKLLGHTSIKTTERYAHLAPNTLKQAVDRLSYSRPPETVLQ